MTWTIYCHTHIESNRKYVGLTKQTMEKRWKNHVYAAKTSKNGKWHFPNAVRKYGPEAFSHEILEVCNTLEEANAAEIKWIEKLNTINPQFGFNLTKGGEHIPHPIENSDEIKKRWDNPEYRKKIVESMKNQWSDPKYRYKMIKMLEDPVKKEQMSHNSLEIHARPDVKIKMSEASKAMWKRDGYRNNRLEKTHTEDFKNMYSKNFSSRIEFFRNRTHCSNGHEYTLENTRISNGSRICLECRKIRHEQFYDRVKSDTKSLENMRKYKREWVRTKRSAP